VGQLEAQVIAGDFAEIAPMVDRIEQALGCGPAADPAMLGRLFRAEGAWLHLTGATDEAAMAFMSSRRVDPGGWTDAYGPQLRAVFEEAAHHAQAGGPAQLRLDPAPPEGFQSLLDGRPADLPAPATPGLYLLQLLPPGADGAQFARLVMLYPGEQVALDPGTLVIPDVVLGDERSGEEPGLVDTPGAQAAGQRRRSWVWLGIGGGAAVAAGATALVARAQVRTAQRAESVAVVDAAERTQMGWGVTSYALLGVSAVSVGLHFTL